MSEERRRILRLLEEKKITAVEAEQLLTALGEPNRGKTLRILIFKGGDEPATRVEVPLGLARWAMKFVPEKELAKHGVKPDQIIDAIENDIIGKIVDVNENDRRIEVHIA